MRKPAWLGEVIVQSIAIVISILLALWVDQWKQNRAAHELAIVSLSNFLTEIQQNEARIDDILPYHRGIRTMVDGLVKSHAAKSETDFENEVGIDGLRPPNLLETAWQTALATGALTHLDYETVSVLSLTYTTQDRFREDSRTGIQSVMQAANNGGGDAGAALRTADNYLRETVTSEENLRAFYAQAEQVLRRKLNILDAHAAKDASRADSAHSDSRTCRQRSRRQRSPITVSQIGFHSMISYRDFAPHRISSGGLLHAEKYETFDDAVKAANEWVTSSGISVTSVETVVMPNIWEDKELGTRDGRVETAEAMTAVNEWYQFVRVWYSS